MQVIVEPISQGKAGYGYSKRVESGSKAVPAIIGLTWIRFRDQSELDHIRIHSAKIIQNFVEEPGFISIVTGAVGDRAFTVTAWEGEAALHSALDKAHSRAKHDFRTGISHRACGPAYGSQTILTASGRDAPPAISRTM